MPRGSFQKRASSNRSSSFSGTAHQASPSNVGRHRPRRRVRGRRVLRIGRGASENDRREPRIVGCRRQSPAGTGCRDLTHTPGPSSPRRAIAVGLRPALGPGGRLASCRPSAPAAIPANDSTCDGTLRARALRRSRSRRARPFRFSSSRCIRAGAAGSHLAYAEAADAHRRRLSGDHEGKSA